MAGSRGGIPVLRDLGPVARVVFVATLLVQVVGVVLDLVVHVDPTVLFIPLLVSIYAILAVTFFELV